MSRPRKPPRLYLLKGRRDSRTGKTVPDTWVIRDGASQIGTGCGAERLQEAEQQLADYITSKWSAPEPRTISRSDPAQVLIAEVLALYAREKGAGDLDRSTFEGFLTNLLDWWGERTIADVKRSTCKAYIEKRCQDPDKRFKKNPHLAPRISAQTPSRELDVLSAAIGYWHGEDTLQNRPSIWKPEKPETPRDALTRSQAAALLMAAMGWRWTEVFGPHLPGEAPKPRWVRQPSFVIKHRAHLRRFLLIGLYTGPRQKVIIRMGWHESPDRPFADLARGIIHRRGRSEADKATKRRPICKIPRRLLAHMRRWAAADLRRAAEVQELLRAGEDVAPFSNTVIHHGGQELAGRIRTGFEGIVRDAGLEGEITPHWMRHTAATWLMESGVDMWDAAGYLGMTVATLEAHYGHHRPDYQASAADGISRSRGVSGKVSGKQAVG